jgi:peptidyl-prolyl cis-trans isomerase B (cyclophilin B)
VPTEKRQRQKEGRRVRLEAKRKQERRRQLVKRATIIVVVAGAIIASVIYFFPHSTPKPLTPQQKVDQVAGAQGCPTTPASASTKPVNTLTWKAQPAMVLNKSMDYYAKIDTTQGPIEVKLNVKGAPVNVNSFDFLAQQGFYTCNPIWRVSPGFVAQTGDPSGTGQGGPGYKVNTNEFPPKGTVYKKGTVAMANSCPQSDTPAQCPLTNGSQFFFVTGPQGATLGAKYTIIGQVIGGYPALNMIDAQGDPNVATDQLGNHPAVVNTMLSVNISSFTPGKGGLPTGTGGVS